MNSIVALIKLMRPLEWSKSWQNMLLAAIIAIYLYNANFEVLKFIFGMIAIAFLFSGLYTLNDYADRKADSLHPVKRNRPIPSGAVKANHALLFGILLILIAFAIGLIATNSLFLICLGAITLNQFAYSHKPLNLKKRPIVDLISGSLVNPFFRFYSGWVLVINNFNAPLLPIIFVLALQFGGYTLYRAMSRKVERNLRFRSSTILIGARIKLAAYLSLAVAGTSYLLLCLNDIFRFKPKLIGVLPIEFLIIGLFFAAKFSYYEGLVKEPEKVISKKPRKGSIQKKFTETYRQLYMDNIIFILLMLIIFAIKKLFF